MFLTATTSMLPILFLLRGALSKGTMALVKPCFSASFKRSSPDCTGLISPVKPISPKAKVVDGAILIIALTDD